MRARMIHLAGNPSLTAADGALTELADGILLVDGEGRIAALGNARDVVIPDDVAVEDLTGQIVLPGFVDGHVHFPQIYVRCAHGGGQLLEWLERRVFPAEARLADERFARTAARDFCDALIRSGTTSALVFGSQFPKAQEALFEELSSRGLRAVLGRTFMVEGSETTRPLLTDLATGLRLIEEEISRWHPRPAERDRALLQVAVVPRYALSVTTEALRTLGELYARHRDQGVYFTSHLSENDRPGDGEIALVRKTYSVPDYLSVYDGRFLPGGARGGETLLGRRSILAHAVHCTPAERSRLAATDTGVAHCPRSQLFLGSGTMPLRSTLQSGVRLGVGSDVGAGDSLFIPHTLNAAYQVHMSARDSERVALSPAQLLHLATLGGAQLLDISHRTGNLDLGKDADFVVLAPEREEDLRVLLEHAPQDLPSRLFTLLMAAQPRCIARTYVRGRRMELSRS